MAKTKIKKVKLSECCNAPMLGGVQCEVCGSNGKFSTGTAIVKRLDKIIKLLVSTEIKTTAKGTDQPTGERFIDNGDGTISDTKTRLMWQKQGSTERLTYAKAEEFVVELNREEWNDWRIPTREELESILDLTKHDPAIDPMFKCESAGYWSSTPVAYYAANAWVVLFYFGVVSYNGRYGAYYVRPVRQY
jgi:hypothetical protein